MASNILPIIIQKLCPVFLDRNVIRPRTMLGAHLFIEQLVLIELWIHTFHYISDLQGLSSNPFLNDWVFLRNGQFCNNINRYGSHHILKGLLNLVSFRNL